VWRRDSGFAISAIATFALGIGAATAIFSVAYGVALRPLPYPAPEGLVRIYESNTATNEPRFYVSQGAFQEWRETLTSGESLALYTLVRTRYSPGDAPQPLAMMAVSPRFFDVLGVRPLYGRLVRDAILAEHRATGIDRVVPLERLVERATAPARVITQLMAALGVLAVLLAAIGVYGSLSLLVNRTMRDTAVRLALGASPSQTLLRTVIHGLAPVALGAIAGIAGAVTIVSLTRSLLYAVERVDLSSMMVGGLIVLAACAAARLAPALKAARTDPVAVLRV
jgi:hypothetical protein